MARNQTDPEVIFEILDRMGEGSYGSVYKAKHKSTGKIVAIKVIPVELDLNELMKEIAILKDCNSEYVVRYYGSYYKENDLWIVMEYCGGGSLSDLTQKGTHSMKEEEIRHLTASVLLGINYLHGHKKIHRDIKAGNVLMTNSGMAKLADFGVSAQLDSTLSKRKTIIGTPFWMAPEVIQELYYDGRADIWSLGITCIEMAEGQPPYTDFKPMKAIFMIPNRPPPKLKNQSAWSSEFNDFIAQCLIKDYNHRPTAKQLLSHPFVASTVEFLTSHKGESPVLRDLVTRLQDLKGKKAPGTAAPSAPAPAAPAAPQVPAAPAPGAPSPHSQSPKQYSQPAAPSPVAPQPYTGVDPAQLRSPRKPEGLPPSDPTQASMRVTEQAFEPAPEPVSSPYANRRMSYSPQSSVNVAPHIPAAPPGHFSRRSGGVAPPQAPPPVPVQNQPQAQGPQQGGPAGGNLYPEVSDQRIRDYVMELFPPTSITPPTAVAPLTEFIKLKRKQEDLRLQCMNDQRILLEGYLIQMNKLQEEMNAYYNM